MDVAVEKSIARHARKSEGVRLKPCLPPVKARIVPARWLPVPDPLVVAKEKRRLALMLDLAALEE